MLLNTGGRKINNLNYSQDRAVGKKITDNIWLHTPQRFGQKIIKKTTAQGCFVEV